MKFPFFLLIVISNPEAGSITSVTPFQTEAECLSAKRVVEDFKNEARSSFNVFDSKRVSICERVSGKERQVR